MLNKNRNNFLISIFTAVATGLILSLAIIITIYVATNQKVSQRKDSLALAGELSSEESSTTPLTTEDEEGVDDPSFISDFSRILKYKSSNGVEVIESAKDSISSLAHTTRISAQAYIVTDMTSGKVISDKNSQQLLPIASLTKLVTAVMAKKLLNKDQEIEITPEIISVYGTTAHFRLGEKFNVNEILYPLLMVSSNDAAEAIARTYGRQAFIKEMNLWANSIGAYGTYFNDPSGLSSLNIASARDMSIISKWIADNEPEIFDITLTKTKTIRVHTWTNPTHFLNLSAYAGGKNGYTPEANRTGLALFRLGTPEHIYSVVILGSSQRDSDTLNVLDEALR